MPNLTRLEEMAENGEAPKTVTLSPMTTNLCLSLLDRYATPEFWFNDDVINWRLSPVESERARVYQAAAVHEILTQAEGVMAYIGEIRMFGLPAIDDLPAGWLQCNGWAYDPEDYPALYAAIGYTFGESDGFFQVPDLTRRSPQGYYHDESINEDIGVQVGTLLQTGVPQHHHEYHYDQTGSSGSTKNVVRSSGGSAMNTDDGGTAGGVDQRGPRLSVLFAIYAGE